MHKKFHTILNAKAENGIGTTMNVSSYQKVMFSFGTASSANATIKFQGSLSDVAPNFAAVQSVSNQWDYVEVIDIEDSTAIDGDTGIVVSGIDDFRQFQLNCDALEHVNAIISSYIAGSVTLKAVGYYYYLHE